MNTLLQEQSVDAVIVADLVPDRGFPWLVGALIANLLNWLLITFVGLLLPSLFSMAAGLFIYFGIPLGLISAIVLLVSSAFLFAAHGTVQRKFYWVVAISVGCCAFAHVLIFSIMVLCFASLG